MSYFVKCVCFYMFFFVNTEGWAFRVTQQSRYETRAIIQIPVQGQAGQSLEKNTSIRDVLYIWDFDTLRSPRITGMKHQFYDND